MSELDLSKHFTRMTLKDRKFKMENFNERKYFGVRKEKFSELYKRRKESEGQIPYRKLVSRKLYVAEIAHPDGSLVNLGVYTRPKGAAFAYDKAAFKIYGSEAKLNYPHLARDWSCMASPPSSSSEDKLEFE